MSLVVSRGRTMPKCLHCKSTARVVRFVMTRSAPYHLCPDCGGRSRWDMTRLGILSIIAAVSVSFVLFFAYHAIEFVRGVFFTIAGPLLFALFLLVLFLAVGRLVPLSKADDKSTG